MAEWDAEIEITADLVRSLIAEQHPDLVGVAPIPVGEGFDNAAFQVGEWLFRLPRRTFGGEAMAVEIDWLPRLADTLPLAIPAPQRLGVPTDRFPWPWAGYRFLPGETADRARLDAAERAAWAEPLADFLRTLHSIPVPDDAPEDAIGRHEHTRRAQRVIERLREQERSSTRDAAIELATTLAETPPWDGTRVLAHGDLYARHLLTHEGRLTAVIDWGDLHAGDRAVDLSIAWSYLPPAARDRFLDRYGPVDRDTWARARFRAIHYGAALVPYGLDVGDPILVEIGQLALEQALVGC